ncbi:recombinase family protein [Streptomyces zhihengii]|uniref:recombinase family protein n=1 Tax=Streptomyces zhihengii TaxID=1818004 RepID=UPI0033A9B805
MITPGDDYGEGARQDRFGQLHARRRDMLATLNPPTCGFRVVPYALTVHPVAPSATLQRVRAYAAFRGWRVVRDGLWDNGGMDRPDARDGWMEALSLVRNGVADGIVTFDAAAVSALPSEYAAVLDELQNRAGFLAHVPPNWKEGADVAARP